MSRKNLTQEQFRKRTTELLKQEESEPLRWWYLSFADKTFLGGVVVRAQGMVGARLMLPLHGIQSPGGEMAAFPIPDDAVPPNKYHNRLLTKVEIQEFWPDAKTIREHEAEEPTR